ncbi:MULTISPECIES: type II toxin-antitoxin system YhaV family toxin [Pseudomonas]|uniref:Toxin n=1 Tax=Pseudomonas abyssi TaxID=170540 RepID=A0A2A3MDF8_9PSED|nr:type II toxin-antitoxin system YhaV family toxin [Pseudomonas abyssi]MAC99633.1 hypothetical protein [Pseudomonadales bacterium]MAG68273.1 hypothetical protein [Pseudomonadales bacterium]PBK02869.1 hypothetical protein CNQ84_17930 [Pseudomonas abyssi]
MHTGNVAVVNGWGLFGHPLFVGRLEDIVSEVEAIMQKSPDDYLDHPVYKLFEKVDKAIRERVPADPAHAQFLLGNTLGKQNRDWRRVKSALPNRYRLFFRFSSQAPKSIIYVWLNDELTLRQAGARTDVYAVFERMLRSGKVPSSYEALLKTAGALPS